MVAGVQVGRHEFCETTQDDDPLDATCPHGALTTLSHISTVVSASNDLVLSSFAPGTAAIQVLAGPRAHAQPREASASTESSDKPPTPNAD